MSENMKPSGTSYLRDIPITWNAKRIKYCAEICNGAEYSDIVVDEGGFPVMGSGGEFARASHYCYSNKSVLLGRKGTIDKPLFIEEPFWCVDTMFYTKMNKETNAKYLYYCSLNIRFDYYVTSTALPSMTQRDLGSEKIAIPSLSEQTLIADFLDKQCEKIDSIIAGLEKQIELLQKYKKSLITETVTKGLDKSVPMKDSGIEWIGIIPEHWSKCRIKDKISVLTDYTANGSFASLAENVEYLDFEDYARVIRLTDLRVNFENSGIYVSEDAYNFLSKSALFGGEILMANVGAYAGLMCEMPKTTFKATLGPNMFLIKTKNEELLPHYLYFLSNAKLIEDELIMRATSSAQPKLNKLDVKTIPIILPPLDEQKKIANYLDDQCTKIDSIIESKKEQLTKITQHKKSLIYEYVTGKKRVKGAIKNGN